jgi:thiamine biosynthesis protein ThiI
LISFTEAHESHSFLSWRPMKAVVLLSGGIDSPVAAYVMAKADAEVLALHMDNTPYSKESGKAQRIVEQLRKITDQAIPLYIAPHGKFNLSVIEKSRIPNIRCVLCKRFMMRAAEALAVREGCNAIVMGDSMGQVASQTLRNISTEEQAIRLPIVRPLIGMDKEEIIRIAKEIGTYELSIKDAGECGIVPLKPSTGAGLNKILNAESEMNISDMIKGTIEGIEKF